MNKHLLVVFGCGLLSAAAFAQEAKPLSSELDKVGYAIGLNTGNTLSNNMKSIGLALTPEALAGFKDALTGTTIDKINYANGINAGLSLSNGLKRVEADVSMDAILKGFSDAIKGGPAAMGQDEIKAVLTKFQQELQVKAKEKQRIQMEKQAEIDKVDAEKNSKEGAAFLAANATKPGVKTLPSGLQYKVLAEGQGASPKATDTVSVNYRGTFIDGAEFDSNVKRGQPATFEVSGPRGVIAGWTEALQLMKPGAKWQLFIPSALGYKDMRRPGNPPIPPASTLLFDLELIKIEAPAPAPAAGQPLTSDIIKVPSAEGLKKGEKIETLKPEDVEREKLKEQQKPKGNQ